MSNSTVIDVEQLLAPIPGDHPTGQEIPLSEPNGLLIKTKDAWDEARKLIKEQQDKEQCGGIDSQGQPWRRVPDPNWDAVINLATDALGTSKDFRVAAWLTEALLRKYYLPGLRDGLELCLGLCERYWSDIHPAANEEDGHGVTVGAFAGVVSDATASAILSVPVAFGQRPSEREPKRYSALDYSRAKELSSISDESERAHRQELGHIELSEFESVNAVTPAEFHQQNLVNIDRCLEVLASLAEFFQQNCMDDEYGESTVPGVFAFREELEKLRRLVVELSGGPVDEQAQAESDEPSATPMAASQAMTRESAFQAVERIAQFFEKTEPHSPVHYALRQAIRWGKMPLPELLAELIEDGSTMESLRKRVGLPQTETDHY
ncbi:MAG: type VI secretion system protein TssA [Planctomycetales bacterium]|nr:type VI secretion system protein TssA [Planctomycetales bacterium]